MVGRCVVGCVADFVEGCYRSGFRRLTVTFEGAEVGAIWRDSLSRERVWMAVQ